MDEMRIIQALTQEGMANRIAHNLIASYLQSSDSQIIVAKNIEAFHYFGGKFKIRKQIGEYLNKEHKSGQNYYEPFVGSGWILSEISSGPCFASDLCDPLIGMWKALQKGWEPLTM